MIKKIIDYYSVADDVKITKFIKGGIEGVLIFEEGLGNINLFNRDYLPKIDEKKCLDITFPGAVYKIDDFSFNNFDQLVFSGDIIIEYNGLYNFKINNTPDRAISDSKAEPDNLLGARDGFIENIRTNTALLRTRIKSNDLRIEQFIIGRRTQTIVKLFYMESICNDDIKEEIKKYLLSLDVDLVMSILDISQKLCEKSIFQKMLYTGSPEMSSMSLLNGQFVIMIDRIPVVLTAPNSIFFYTKEKNDFELPLYYSIFLRLFILLGGFTSVFGLGIFHSFLTYQSGSLSSTLIDKIRETEQTVILGSFFQIICTLLVFEFYQLVSTRSPGVTVQTIIIVLGGFLIGQNMVSSGIVGVMVLSVTAGCYLSGYIISNNSAIMISISIMRLFILICSLFFGLYGVILGAIIAITYMFNQTSFNVCMTHPFAPFCFNDIKKFFLSRPTTFFKERPKVLKTKDKIIKRDDKK